ncbi:MAG TPA: hypothetical protein EYN07_07930 [Flavobacteriaceae bacterium]|nr:hypothetical protein [Flavobacteriaceae bacterium]HIN99154.1 hypothetical protein [Flavobacteriaceae bacterium]
MSNPAPHIIKAQEFQVVLDNQENAYNIQSGISALQNERLQHLINSILDSYATEDSVYQFETITLELGSIPLINYEQELTHRIETQLHAFFSHHISKNGILRTGKKRTLAPFKLEQLGHYLSHGYTQWNSFSSYAPMQLITELLADQKDGLRKLLRELGQKEMVRKRLVFQFSDTILAQITELVVPEESAYIISYKTEMTKKQQEQPMVKLASTEFRNAIWEVLLAYIFVDSAGYFNKKAFLAYAIKKTALKFNQTYASLLQLLTANVSVLQQQQVRMTEFQKILVDLELESRHTSHEELEMPQQGDDIAEMLQTLDQFLKQGAIPFHKTGWSKRAVKLKIESLIRSKDPTATAKIGEWLFDFGAKKRILEVADHSLLRSLLPFCPQNYQELLFTFFSELNKLAPSLSTAERKLLLVLSKNEVSILLASVEGKNLSEAKILEKIFQKILQVPGVNGRLFSKILTSAKDKLPARFHKPVQQFLASSHQKNTTAMVANYLEEMLAFVTKEPAFIWKYWFNKKLIGWSQKTGLSASQLRKLLLKQTTSLPKNPSIQLIKQVLAEEKVQESFAIQSKLNAAQQKAILKYVISNGLLPWWMPDYTILRFHKDLKEMWRQTASRAELKILFETERIHPYFIRLCSVEGSSMVWELLDPSSTLKYAKFITVLEVVAHSTFFPAGSFKRVQFNVLRSNLVQLLQKKTVSEKAFFSVLTTWLSQQRLVKNKAFLTHLAHEMQAVVGAKFSTTFQQTMAKQWTKGAIGLDKKSILEETNALTESFPLFNAKTTASVATGNLQVLKRELEVFLQNKPEKIKLWLGQPETRIRLLEILDHDLLDVFVETKLTEKQSNHYKNIKLFFAAYQSVLSVQEYTTLQNHFYHLILITWSLNGFSTWNNKQWVQLALRCFVEVLGHKKSGRVLWNEGAARMEAPKNVQKTLAVLFQILQEKSERTLQIETQQEDLRAKNATPSEDKPYKKLGEKMERQFLDPLFIKNAGLILTAPYLGMLFSRLELMQHHVFVNGEAQERAVHLLGYVATGAEDLPEYDLVLQKILCGMLVSEPLKTHTPLTNTEKEMADEMLEAIKQHWKPLNNTSIEAFRESFLIREGKLEDDETAFYLLVEQNTIDILLDQIPWNISKIKLSWMQKILEVQWR